MENASYALKIAGATLIAIMVIALISFVFQILKNYQQSQEDAVTRENISQFNATFEVYDKSLMYGTDVLSCLNQAESNNQKYVYSIYYSTDNSTVTDELIDELMVQVVVNLENTLEEEIEVYYRDVTSGSIIQTTLSLMQNSGLSSGYNFQPFSNSKGFSLPNVTFYYFTRESSSSRKIIENTDSYADLVWTTSSDSLSTNFKLKPGTYKTSITAGEYKLVADSGTTSENDKTGKLIALLSTVTQYEQTIYNDTYTGSGYTGKNGWYSATWTTAVYDFKTRKFKCTSIGYSEQGYVNYLEFEEV